MHIPVLVLTDYQVLTTAIAVYEAIEPLVIWKSVFVSVRDGLNTGGSFVRLCLGGTADVGVM